MKNQAIYKVFGRSMEADFIYQGDFLIVKKKASIVNHDIVVFSLPDKSFLVKHIYRKKKHLFFYPFSITTLPKKIYRPLDEAVVIGKVVAVISNHKKRKT